MCGLTGNLSGIDDKEITVMMTLTHTVSALVNQEQPLSELDRIRMNYLSDA